MGLLTMIERHAGGLADSDRRLVSVATLLLAGTTYLLYGTFRGRNRAPGPPRLPILGNLLQMPSQLKFVKFAEWAQEYGPIFSLDALGQHIVVLNTYECAGDLLDRRSNTYNDRPRMVMANELQGGGAFLPLIRNGDLWRRMRRAVHESFNARAVEQYKAIQHENAALAMIRILQNPTTWEQNLETINGSAIASSVYGWPPLEPGSPVIKHVQDFLAYISSTMLPGNHLVDTFPILKHVPASMARWKREALDWYERQHNVFDGFRRGVEEKMIEGDSQSTFLCQLIEDKDRHGLSEREFTWLPTVLIVATTDTTAVALINCVLAMLHYPDVLSKAHAELDAIVGRDRAPRFEDEGKLPYIRAIVRETLRWRPPAPLGVPHVATEDSWYKGYFIPKDTVVMGNIWAMNRDPTIYPDPDAFRPERFIDTTGKVDVIPDDTHGMGHTSYGFGNRICPGMYFANQSLFIDIATMLWAFDIKPCVDERGKALLPPTDQWVDATIVVRPASFECNFTPRFSDAQEILEATATPRTSSL